MKSPRITLASIAVTVLILAIDFAIVRAALTASQLRASAMYALLLMPMLDYLLIRTYRLRLSHRRKPGAVASLVAGAFATVALFAACASAPMVAMKVLVSVGRPIAGFVISGLTRVLGNAAMQRMPMQLTVGILLDLLLPVFLFCGPPLLIALVAGRAGRWIGMEETSGGDADARDSVQLA